MFYKYCEAVIPRLIHFRFHFRLLLCRSCQSGVKNTYINKCATFDLFPSMNGTSGRNDIKESQSFVKIPTEKIN